MHMKSFLTISKDYKGIPYYGDGVLRPDGDANYGFKNLKGRHDEIDQIPEMQRDEAMAGLAHAINEAETGLFSIGCVSGEVADENGFRWSGYMEFAWNSRSKVADAQTYFPVFFHFVNSMPREGDKPDAEIHWELMGAHFSEGGIDGFSCVLTINTYYRPTKEEAQSLWWEVTGGVAGFLNSVREEIDDPIYFSPSDS